MERFSLADIFSKNNASEFHSSHITERELETMLRDVVQKEHPKNSIKKFKYNENGVVITLDNDDIIEIEVDWQEIILSQGT